MSNNNVSTLMCGDVPYDCLPDSIIKNQDYEYVIIPHHASNMSDKSMKSLDSMAGIHYPIICVDGDEDLGKTCVQVKNGDHCKKIVSKVSKKTPTPLYFTDAKNKKVSKYECDLTGQKGITVHP